MSNCVVKLDSTVLTHGSLIKEIDEEADSFPYRMYTVFLWIAEVLQKTNVIIMN